MSDASTYSWTITCKACGISDTVQAQRFPPPLEVWDFTPCTTFLIRRIDDEAAPEILSARCQTCSRIGDVTPH